MVRNYCEYFEYHLWIHQLSLNLLKFREIDLFDVATLNNPFDCLNPHNVGPTNDVVYCQVDVVYL